MTDYNLVTSLFRWPNQEMGKSSKLCARFNR